MADIEKINVPSYTLSLTVDEAKGLITLLGAGSTVGVLESLKLTDVHAALHRAGLLSDPGYRFDSVARRFRD